MRSIVAVTNEMDDAEKAVADLLRQIEEKGPLNKNSLGMFFCDVEADHEKFAAMLQERLPFDVFGCTTIATFDTKNGAQIMSVVLVILTADDAEFSSALTGVLTADNLRAEMEAAYKKASSGLEGPNKLIFIAPPFTTLFPPDDYIDILSELSGDTPVFGGLPSSSVPNEPILMYAGGRSYGDRAAIVLVGGNVRPVFSVQNVLSKYSEQKATVTKSDKNVIYRVNDMPFTEYLKSAGMEVDELIAQNDRTVFASTPLKVNLSKNDYHDGIPVVRTFRSLSSKDGSGVMSGAIPEKSTVSLVTMKRQDIQDSCRMAIEEIREKIAAEGGDYVYGTLLCVSCGARYIVMADDNEIEGCTLVENLPENLNLAGFYAYGEICPTVFRDGKAVNRLHNESIVMCAL